MKKIIVLVLVIVCASSLVKAQDEKKLKFSVGAELSIPTGTFSKLASFGVGATGQIEYNLQEKLYATGTSGVLFYNGKSLGNGIKSTGPTIVPIRIGAKYFLAGGVYVAAQIGVGIFGNNAEFNGTAFAYSPMAGYEFKTKSDKALDATFKYDGYSKNGTLGNIGFRLAYVF